MIFRETGAEISPTAKLTADLRRYSDIPFADAIAEIMDAKGYASGMPIGSVPPDVVRWMAPLIEARYKCLSRAVEQAQVSQVLEFASGFSFRGVAMTANSDLLYLETDLPEIHDVRVGIRSLIETKFDLPRHANCIFETASILSPDDFERVSKLLRPDRPVAVIHEGIFPYLSQEEKCGAATNIAKLLNRFGGVWITPDFKSGHDGIEKLWQTRGAQAVGQYLGKLMQRGGVRDQSLSSESKIRAFLASHGLVGEMQLAVPALSMLSCTSRVNSVSAELKAIQSALALWVIRPSGMRN